MSQFTVVVVGLADVAKALTNTGQFKSVVPVNSTGGLRDLLQSKKLTPGASDKVFLFSDETPVDTPQSLEFLIQRMTSMKARVIIVATGMQGRQLVEACPGAGLLQGPLHVNTVVGAMAGMDVDVTPVPDHENYPIGAGHPSSGPVAREEPVVNNPFGAPTPTTSSNPFAAPAAPAASAPAAPAPPSAPAPAPNNPFAPAAPTETPAPSGGNNPFATPAAPPAAPPAPSEGNNPFAAPAAPAPAAPNNPFAPAAPTETPAPSGGNNPFATPAAPPAPSEGNNPFAAPAAPAPAAPNNPFAPAAPVVVPAPVSGSNPFATQTTPTGPNNSFGGVAQVNEPVTAPATANPFGGPVSRHGVSTPERPVRRGYVVTITAPKGGTGKSSLSLNLAAYLGLRLQGTGKNVCLIDANVQQPDTGKYLNSYTPNVEDVLRDPSAIHPDRIGNYLLHKPEYNLSALLGPMTVDSAHPVYFSGQRYSQMLEAIKPNYDYIIIDTPVAEFYHDIFREFALPHANFVCVAITPNYTTLMNTDGWLNQICAPKQANGMGIDPQNVGIVLNRAEEDIGLSEQEVIKELGNWQYLGAIPETKEWKRCNNLGLLVATRNFHELNEAFSNILAQATGEEILRTTPANLPAESNGVFGKLKDILKRGGSK